MPQGSASKAAYQRRTSCSQADNGVSLDHVAWKGERETPILAL
jgi:hypothetical protein